MGEVSKEHDERLAILGYIAGPVSLLVAIRNVPDAERDHPSILTACLQAVLHYHDLPVVVGRIKKVLE